MNRLKIYVAIINSNVSDSKLESYLEKSEDDLIDMDKFMECIEYCNNNDLHFKLINHVGYSKGELKEWLYSHLDNEPNTESYYCFCIEDISFIEYK